MTDTAPAQLVSVVSVGCEPLTKRTLAVALNRSERWVETRASLGMPAAGFDSRGRRLFDLDACRAWIDRQAANTARSRRSANDADVYFIEGAGLIKIGLSVTVGYRLETLQVMSPVPLELLGVLPNAGIRCERWLHCFYEPLRQHGEWFTATDELRDLAAGKRADIIARYEAGELA